MQPRQARWNVRGHIFSLTINCIDIRITHIYLFGFGKEQKSIYIPTIACLARRDTEQLGLYLG